MKSKCFRFLMVAGVVALSFFAAKDSFATMESSIEYGGVDYSGAFVDMGTLSNDQYGEITSGNEGFGSAVISQVTAYLPSNSMIEFTYSFDGYLVGSLLSAGGTYSYDGYEGFTASVAPNGIEYSAGTYNGNASTALAFSTAQITGTNSATVTIKNLSGGVLDIMSLFVGVAMGSKDYTISYTVSEVPLPAALPVLGLGLGAMFGYRSRKKKAA